MLLDYSEKGKIKIDMKRYIKDMIEAFPGYYLTKSNAHGIPDYSTIVKKVKQSNNIKRKYITHK